MITLLYGIVILFATVLGAFVGLGGGVIIKPILDFIGCDSIDTVNFLSGCAVFSMSAASIAKHLREKTKIDFRFVCFVSLGAVTGGIAGARFFDYMMRICDSPILKAVQGLLLGVLLVVCVLYVNAKNAKSLNIRHPLGTLLAGLFLGFTASFLGVGGGPINVAFLAFFFSVSIKDGAVYSVAVIFFSQLAKLVSIGAAGTVPAFKPITLAVAVVCAVAGGIIGTKMNKKFDERIIRKTFTIVVAAVAVVNFCNAAKGFIF